MRALRFFLLPLAISLLLSGCAREVFTGKREARGMWMSRFEYASRNADSAKAKISHLFEKARHSKFNMVFFQVRGSGDAYYKSNVEPWGELLTGALGKDPGWDPLQYAVDEAHRLGLEMHVWINVFPIWRGADPPPETTPRSAMLEHPEWIVCERDGTPMKYDPPNNNYVWISPGNPAARQHVLSVIKDIVGRYDIDGLHFDYVRYPEGSVQKGYSHDPVSVARFNSPEGNPGKLLWEHWQRDQLSQFIFDAYNLITGMKPWVKVSAAVIGKMRGSGWTSYDAVFQDARRWMEVGKIDFILPMLYRQRTHPTHPFIPLLAEWQDRTWYDRQIFPGLGTRLIQNFGWEEIVAQIREVRQRGLPGVVFYSATGLEQVWEKLGVDEFPYWSLAPRTVWRDSTAPAPPLEVTAEHSTAGVVVRWKGPEALEPVRFVVYRSDKPAISREDVFAIATVTRINAVEYVDPQPLLQPMQEVYYAVTAVDRLSNESVLSRVVRAARPPASSR
jgi:uncharacterized lipoprotein YddW (UPF0748 family)